MTTRFSLHSLPATPWKNGGGTTREIACFPHGASLTDFEWRLSIADVNADGAFSVFPNIDRTIVLLSGNGMKLNDVALTNIAEPYAFAGETEIYARLINGATTDFNVMVRRGGWQAEVRAVRDAETLSADAHAFYVLHGRWNWNDAAHPLNAGQGFVSQDQTRSTLTPTSSDALALAVTLIRV
jgi:uncharacterized protein